MEQLSLNHKKKDLFKSVGNIINHCLYNLEDLDCDTEDYVNALEMLISEAEIKLISLKRLEEIENGP